MIKGISLLKRKQGISREEFLRHYEEVHVPLAMKHFPFKKYVRNYVTGDAVDFDCITEVWFETMEDCEKAAAFSVSPEYKIISDDEEKFMDRASIVAFLVEERTTG
ncbi:MAG: EthD domain-containing protein [Dehalococcoidia bacterium]|nr:EthD domain-containing protein [Dehalococcoidia bacterium]